MTSTLKLVVAAGSFMDLNDVREQYGNEASIEERDIGTTGEDLAAATADADGVAVALHEVRREHFEAMAERVKVVGRGGIGLDTIDLEAAKESGVAVIHQPEYATETVSTHAVALMLAVHRRVVDADAIARTEWGQRHVGTIPAIEESTVGIVGCGRIGRATIAKVRPFAREVVVYDPFVDEAPEGTSVANDLFDLLERCAFTSLHLPLVPETTAMISTEELEAMPAGSVLVNVSRGGLIDERAVADALHNGHLSGAGLDVLSEEPPSADNPLLHAPNVVLSPHIAWYSMASERRLKQQTIGDMIAYLANRPITGRLAVDPRAQESA